MQNEETTGGATREDQSAGNASGENTGGAGGGMKQTKTYTVQSGDTLSKIAKEHYGDPNRYMEIFEANREQLSHPDKIQPGQELIIP